MTESWKPFEERRKEVWKAWDEQVTRAESMSRGPLAYAIEPDRNAVLADVRKTTDFLRSQLDYIQDPPYCDPEEIEHDEAMHVVMHGHPSEDCPRCLGEEAGELFYGEK